MMDNEYYFHSVVLGEMSPVLWDQYSFRLQLLLIGRVAWKSNGRGALAFGAVRT